jgi:hypothetical protein
MKKFDRQSDRQVLDEKARNSSGFDVQLAPMCDVTTL